MKNKSTLFLVQAALIGAIYVVLTLVFAPFSYGEVQVRISEALTILPYFTPAAIPGLFVRMYHCQYPGRLYPGRHHLRKHCHTAGRSFYLQAA